jgi:hypothetical protein
MVDLKAANGCSQRFSRVDNQRIARPYFRHTLARLSAALSRGGSLRVVNVSRTASTRFFHSQGSATIVLRGVMIQHRRLIVVGILLLAGAGALTGPSSSRSALDAYESIKLGASRAEVWRVIACLPGDHRNWPTCRDWAKQTVIAERTLTRLEWSSAPQLRDVWQFDAGEVGVEYTPDGIATSKWLSPHTRDARCSVLEDMAWRAKREWHRWFP